MPATILGMPVERCTASSSAIGAAANLIRLESAFGASQVEDAIARVGGAPSEMSRPPAARASVTLSVAPRLRPAVRVASDSRSHVASGRRSATCAARHAAKTTPSPMPAMMPMPARRASASHVSAVPTSSIAPLMSRYEQPASRQAARIDGPISEYGPAASSTQRTRDSAARSGRVSVLRPVVRPSGES